jgi:hypothetical protein
METNYVSRAQMIGYLQTADTDVINKIQNILNSIYHKNDQIALSDLNLDRASTSSNYKGKYTLDTNFFQNLANNIGTVANDVKNSKLIIIHNYDLEGKNVTIPDGSDLNFEGGTISNGTIDLNKAYIYGGLTKFFGLDLDFTGTTKNTVWYPEWFGAKFDGVTDDILAINKCIEAVNSVGGGSVMFPFKNTIISDSIILKDNVKLVSNFINKGWISFSFAINYGGFIKLADGVNKPMIMIEDGASNWGIHNLRLNGNRENNTSEYALGIYDIEYSNAVDITGNLIMNTQGWGYYKMRGGTTTIRGNSIESGVCLQSVSDTNIIDNSIFIDNTNRTVNRPSFWGGDIFFKNQINNNFFWNGTDENQILKKEISSISGEVISFAASHGFYRGMPMVWVTDGTLPEPLASLTYEATSDTYYVTVIDSTTCKLSNSADNFINGVFIDFTDDGTGTQYLSYGRECVALLAGRRTQGNLISVNRIEDGFQSATILDGIFKNSFTCNYSGKSNRNNLTFSAGISLINGANNNVFSGNIFGRDKISLGFNFDKIGLHIDSTSYKNSFENNFTTNNISLNISDEYADDFENRNLYGEREKHTTGISIPHVYGVSAETRFNVSLSADTANITVDGNTDIVFDDVITDNSSSIASGVFTAKEKGVYAFNFNLMLEDVDADASYYLALLSTTQNTYRFYLNPASVSDFSFHTVFGNTVTPMDIGDTAKIIIFQSGGASQTKIRGSATSLLSTFNGTLLK